MADHSLQEVLDDEEKKACIAMDPCKGAVRDPPLPHELTEFLTPDEKLFQTTHMGVSVIDIEKYTLTVCGLVHNPLTLTLPQLQALAHQKTITSFHECYGPPALPPTTNRWRIGNITWTGVPLSTLLTLSHPLPTGTYIWTSGLDHGIYAGEIIEQYEKDLPLAKAMSEEVLLAWAMNGRTLERERGGPLRLVVPGWFGTNSTKWVTRVEVRGERARGVFTTRLYNEIDPTSIEGRMRPVWEVEPNSMIVYPAPGARVEGEGEVEVWGWAWSCEGILAVEVSVDGGENWDAAEVLPRTGFSWQKFVKVQELRQEKCKVLAKAQSLSGLKQPMEGRRNHVHGVEIEVI